MRPVIIVLCLMLAGCVMGIPDAGPAPPKPPEPCEIWVIDYSRQRAVCMSRERFRREVAPVLLPSEP